MCIRKTVAWSLMSLAVLAGCRRADDVWPNTGKKRVLVSFPPLYCFTKNVAGDDADVRCLTTAAGPHEFKATPNDALLAQKADVFLINGLGLDESLKKLRKEGAVEIAEDAVPDKQLIQAGKDADHKDDGHKHGEYDPHVWLGPPEAKAIVEAIAAKLGDLDPPNKKKYEERAQAYVKELEKLHEHGKAAFANKKSRNIIATHDSLHYFARAFGLKVVDHIQPRPGVEADSPTITRLVKICKEQGVTIIAVEPQYSKGPAEALKSQLGNKGVAIQLVEVDPLETAPAADNKADPDPAYYMKRMYDNIDNLAKALP
jgi:zinc transport system substrate-binding protein